MVKKLNNKGFTLVEVLAVVVILSVLLAIMVPNVNHLIDQNKENNYKDFENGLIQATKVLLSDYRYKISIDGSCSNDSEEKNVLRVGEYYLQDSKLKILYLVEENNISTDSEGNIHNPKDKEKVLDLDSSYILVKYQCKTKDYRYELMSDSLAWR